MSVRVICVAVVKLARNGFGPNDENDGEGYLRVGPEGGKAFDDAQYADVRARDMVQSLDGQAYADVAAVVGATGDGGYEEPASSYA